MVVLWESILRNFWGILGVLVSGIGLFLAFHQLRKIADRTAAIDDTYKKTIEELKNNETLTNISIVLQKIEAIKSKFQNNKVQDSIHDLAFVAKLLESLQSGISGELGSLNFDVEKGMFNELEVKIITEVDDFDKSNFKDEYIAFSKLELQLTKLQGHIKFKKK